MKTKPCKLWVFIPAIVSFLILAAHFSRNNHTALIIIALAIPLLLIIRKIWSIRLIQFLLLLGAAEWVRATFEYVKIRQEMNENPTVLIMILGVVVFFTLLSGALLFLVKKQD